MFNYIKKPFESNFFQWLNLNDKNAYVYLIKTMLNTKSINIERWEDPDNPITTYKTCFFSGMYSIPDEYSAYMIFNKRKK